MASVLDRAKVQYTLCKCSKIQQRIFSYKPRLRKTIVYVHPIKLIHPHMLEDEEEVNKKEDNKKMCFLLIVHLLQNTSHIQEDQRNTSQGTFF
jgi:hypothetical protein